MLPFVLLFISQIFLLFYRDLLAVVIGMGSVLSIAKGVDNFSSEIVAIKASEASDSNRHPLPCCPLDLSNTIKD
jgi:hypothetical protein